jgi:hypothetical protein
MNRRTLWTAAVNLVAFAIMCVGWFIEFQGAIHMTGSLVYLVTLGMFFEQLRSEVHK